MDVVQLELLTFGLIELLGDGTGRPIGDADAPRDAAGDLYDFPWGIVYPLEGGSSWGPVANWRADRRVPYQVTSSGRDRRQAQAMADRVRTVILDRATYPFPAVAGLKVIDRDVQDTNPGVDREGTVWSVPETFYITVTPT